MKTKAILFDLDGTLAYTLEDIADSMNIVLSELNFPVHRHTNYRQFIGHGIKNLVLQALPKKSRDTETLNKAFERMKNCYRQNCLNKTTLYNDIAETINVLKKKGFNLAVFSNKSDDLTQLIVSQLFPEGTFDVVLGSTKKLKPKPHPEGILYILKQLNIDASQTIYIGDSDTDMETAKQANVYAMGVSWGYRSKKTLSDSGAQCIIDSPREIITKTQSIFS